MDAESPANNRSREKRSKGRMQGGVKAAKTRLILPAPLLPVPDRRDVSWASLAEGTAFLLTRVLHVQSEEAKQLTERKCSYEGRGHAAGTQHSSLAQLHRALGDGSQNHSSNSSQKSHHGGLDLGAQRQLVSNHLHLLSGTPGSTRAQRCQTARRAKP